MLGANLDIIEDNNCKRGDKYCQRGDKIVKKEIKKSSKVWFSEPRENIEKSKNIIFYSVMIHQNKINR